MIVAVVLPLFAAGRADAIDRGGLTVSAKQADVTKDYGPIAGNNPQSTLLHKPANCMTQTYCDVITLKVDTTGLAEDDLYEVAVTVSWSTTDAPEVGTVNDLDLYIYDSKGVRVAQDAHAAQPETTSIDTPPAGTYYIVINNATGPNTGYSTEVEFLKLGKQKAIPKFNRPGASGGPLFTPLPPLPTGNAVPPPEASLQPGETLAPVVTPGANGPPTALALEGVEAGSKVDNGGLTWWGYLIMSVAIAAVGGGAGFIVFRRFRARGV